ncbi:hypothetical protein KVV02_006096 [Mortierella alpina]|uniref:Uncharacterized protein n=1 Tax=Mortierella alpina TaxID=64518 RepID=A0A9P8CYG4_MORAP|nr:hypothetical protein KVV02_006096 [Mortierella alpina]
MTVDQKSPARAELLRISRKHQRRGKRLATSFVALISRIQSSPSPPSSRAWPPTAAAENVYDDRNPRQSGPAMSEKSAPTLRQLKLPQDALVYLIDRLERDPDGVLITPDDIAGLRTSYKALLSAAYYSLYMATSLSATSEDSCWIGSGLARTTGGQTSAFKERDWANGRVYYEDLAVFFFWPAYYIFRLGLEDFLAFMKSETSTAKYHPSLEKRLKDLKQELR